MPERRAEKSQGPCIVDGAVDMGAIGSGLGKMGAGSEGTVLVSTDWTGAGSVGTLGMQLVGAAGVCSLDAPVAEVCAQGATSPFDRVTVGLGSAQMGCEGVTGLASGWGAGMGLANGDGGLGGA